MRYYLSDYNGNITAEHETDSIESANLYFQNAGYNMDKHFVVSENNEENEED